MSDHAKEMPPVARLLGREVVSVDQDSGEVTLRFVARKEFANRYGIVHGGMLAAMLDSATAHALMARLPSHLTALTIRLDTQFLKPAALGVITATARVTNQDERSAEARAELTDSEGKIIATARAELRIRERKKTPWNFSGTLDSARHSAVLPALMTFTRTQLRVTFRRRSFDDDGSRRVRRQR